MNKWGSMLLAAVVGCGGGGGPIDGSTPGGPNTAAATVAGARSASVAYDGEENFVTCRADTLGNLWLDAALSAGSDQNFHIGMEEFDGAGTYEYVHQFGGNPFYANVSLAGGYRYQFGRDQPDIGTPTVSSTCTVVVAEPSPNRIDAMVTCSGLIATTVSSDYPTVDAMGYRPQVDLTAHFECSLE